MDALHLPWELAANADLLLKHLLHDPVPTTHTPLEPPGYGNTVT